MPRTRARDGAFAQSRGIFITRRRIHDLDPVLPVLVANEHRNRRAEGLAGAHTAQEFDLIAFDLHASSATVSLLAAEEISVDVGGSEWKAGWHAFEGADECGAV